MFTGIIKEIGIVKSKQYIGGRIQLSISVPRAISELEIGDSVGVNGVCLTVKEKKQDTFVSDLLEETVQKTNLSLLKVGDKVNIEPSLRVNGKIGGHFVTGHIDGVGKIISRINKRMDTVFRIERILAIRQYVVEKGSIAVDGVSLTVVEVKEKWFSVHLIPHTLDNTILGMKKVGDKVNLEADLIGKYVSKILHTG